jgi:hypothetical protein
MGKIMISKKIDDLFDTDWVIDYAKSELGEEAVINFLQDRAEKNQNIKVFFEEYRLNKQNRQKYQENRQKEVPDFKTIISIVQEYCSQEKLRLLRRNILRRLGEQADKSELIKVAQELESTTDEMRQLALLHVFITAQYPLSIDFLLKLAHSPNKTLAGAVVTALANIKDERIHNLAIELIRDIELSYDTLRLFIQNFQNDYDIILDLLKRENQRLKIEESDFDFHSLTMQVRHIFEHNKGSESLDILLFLYHNTICSHCRMQIVKIMCDNDIILDNLVEECQYDCDEETRNIVSEYIKQKMDILIMDGKKSSKRQD